MADGVKVSVRNKDRLFGRLRRLAPEAHGEIVRANEDAADEMVLLAKSLVPVRTGALRNSIRKESTSVPGVIAVKAGGAATTKEARAGSGARFDYALAAEFGTQAHQNAGRFEGSENPGTRAQPFFFPSFRLVKRKHKTRVKAAMRKATKKVAGR